MTLSSPVSTREGETLNGAEAIDTSQVSDEDAGPESAAVLAKGALECVGQVMDCPD